MSYMLHEVVASNQMCKEINDVIIVLNSMPKSEETTNAVLRLREAVMWIDANMKRIKREHPGMVENLYTDSTDYCGTAKKYPEGVKLEKLPTPSVSWIK